MIEYLVKLQLNGTCENMIKAAVPALEKYGLLDSGFTFNSDDHGEVELKKLVDYSKAVADESILVFDVDCIEDEHDYASLVFEFFVYAQEQDQLTKVKSDYNPEKAKAGVALLVNGEQEKASWAQLDNGVAKEFYQFMDYIFEKHFDKKVMRLSKSKNFERMLLVDKEDYLPIKHLFDFDRQGFSPRKTYNVRTASTVFVSIVGFCALSIIGWSFIGFLWATLASFTFCASAAAMLILKHNWSYMLDEEALIAERQREDSFGRTIMNAAVNHASKQVEALQINESLTEPTMVDAV